MTINNFDKSYLLGGYLQRKGRVLRHPLQTLGVSPSDLEQIRLCRDNFTDCAKQIGSLAKAGFLQDLETPHSISPISLAQRVKYLTAHVYSDVLTVSSEEEELLVSALNRAISAYAEDLIRDCCTPKDQANSLSISTSIRTQTQRVVTQYHLLIQEKQKATTPLSIGATNSPSPLQQISAWWHRSQKLPKQLKTLQAVHHTHGILTQILGGTSLHQIRTKATSQFYTIVQPKNGNLGKDFTGFTIAFAPIYETKLASSPSSCTPLRSFNEATNQRACIPVEIQIGDQETKWMLIELHNEHAISLVVQEWLGTKEGKTAKEQALKSSWSLEDEMAEVQYRHETARATDTTKQHTIFARHVYVSSREVLLGKTPSQLYKYDGELGQGNFNTLYKARTVDFSSILPYSLVHAVRKPSKGRVKTPQEIEHRQKLYEHLAGCPNIAVPKIKKYRTMGSNKEKFLEVIPYYNLGSLARFASKDEAVLLEICLQSAKGIAAMHAKRCWHGDLKPANMLAHQELRKPIEIFIGDIDDAAFFGENSTACTWDYLAPECKSGWQATEQGVLARDSYAFGKSLYQITHEQTTPPIGFGTRKEKPTASASYREKQDYIISQLLLPNPEERMTVAEAYLAFNEIHSFAKERELEATSLL